MHAIAGAIRGDDQAGLVALEQGGPTRGSGQHSARTAKPPPRLPATPLR
jgi:hypothetical protein